MRELETMKQYDALDLEYFYEVIRIVDKQYLGDAEELFLQSSFLELFDQDPSFVYYYHPSYWADFVLNQWRNQQNQHVS